MKKTPYIVEVIKIALAFLQQMWYDAYAEMRFCHLKNTGKIILFTNNSVLLLYKLIHFAKKQSGLYGSSAPFFMLFLCSLVKNLKKALTNLAA